MGFPFVVSFQADGARLERFRVVADDPYHFLLQVRKHVARLNFAMMLHVGQRGEHSKSNRDFNMATCNDCKADVSADTARQSLVRIKELLEHAGVTHIKAAQAATTAGPLCGSCLRTARAIYLSWAYGANEPLTTVTRHRHPYAAVMVRDRLVCSKK